MRFFSHIFLPFLLLGYVITETYLKLQHTFLCDEIGCKLTAELFNFDALYFHYLSLASLFLLIIFGYLSLRNKFYEALFFIVLYTVIAFAATILSNQFIANTEPCIFCYTVFSSSLLIALFSQPKHFVITLAIVFAIFVGLKTFAVTKNKTFVSEPGNYLIQSDLCRYCIKVKAYFAENHINYTAIPIREAGVRPLLKFLNIRGIPVLIIKEKSKTTLIKGDKLIIAYFEGKKEEKEPIQTSGENTLSEILSSDFLSAGGDNTDCALTITEQSSCEDNKTTNQH